MTWLAAVSIIFYLAGLNMAAEFYPQSISWEPETRLGKIALWATIAFWPLVEIYTIVLEKVLGE